MISKESDSSGNPFDLGNAIEISFRRIVFFNRGDSETKFISSLAIEEGFEITQCSDFNNLQNLIKASKFEVLIIDVELASSRIDEFLTWLSKLGNSKPYLILSLNRDSGYNVSNLIQYGVDEFLYSDSKSDEIRSRFKLIESKLKNQDFLREKNSRLRRDKKRYESLFIESPEAMLVLQNREGKVIGVNRSVKSVLGYDGKALLGKYMSLIFPKIFGKDGYASNGDVISGSTVLQSIPYRKPDGNMTSLDIMMSAVPWDSGYALMMLCRDVGHRNNKDNDSMLESKKKAIECFAAGISDEFGDLFTSIEGNLSLICLDSLNNHDSIEAMNRAQSACERGREILLEVSAIRGKTRPLTKRRILLPKLIRNTLSFSLFEFDGIKPVIKIKPQLSEIKADEGQLRRMFGALIKNAAQNISKEGIKFGEIVIEGENREVTSKDDLPLVPGSYVQLSFKDNGPGLTNDEMSRVFDPYFSKNNNGRGFGLSRAATICRSHGGHIAVNSEEGKGACFDVFLPATLSAREPSDTSLMNSSSLRVLVLDDEPHICAIVEKSLQKQGHDVYCASTGKAAMRAFEKSEEFNRPFDVLILDLDIRGGMGGNETLSRIRSIEPNVKAIVTTGFVDDLVLENYLEHGFSGVLTKPFRISKLIATVEKLGNQR